MPYDVTSEHGTESRDPLVRGHRRSATAFPLGSHTFTAEEIIRFGKLYDPQYFHVDPEAAKHSHFGGLVASGWHTVTIGHRKMVDAIFAEEERIRAGSARSPASPAPPPASTRWSSRRRSGPATP